MKPIFTLLFVANFLISLGQESPFKVANEELESNGYYAAINKLIELEKTYTVEHPDYKSTYYQLLSPFYSFVGEDSLAEKSFLKALRIDKRSNISHDSLPFENAIDYISKSITNQRVVIVNEAHHLAKHRILSLELLDTLKKKGFTHIALEGLANDTFYSKNGYPKQLKTGFYISEPIFGNLLRKAHKLGFTVFGYDKPSGCNYDKEKPNYCKNKRELIQAVEINNVLQNDSNAKVFAHCGFAHLEEKTKDDWIKMAEYLEMISGVDPLTIDQTYSLYFKGIENIDEPIVYLKNDSAYIPPKKEGFYDIQVFWPKVNYQEGRPSFYEMISSFKKVSINTDLKSNTIVQAFGNSESKDAIPIDQFIVRDSSKNYSLYLPSGDFTIKISDDKNKEISRYITEVQ
jgi:hypothetical protein